MLHLKGPYVYHTGVRDCGCGLPEGVPVGQQDEWTQKHHRQLGDYVEQCLENAELVEFFSYWDTDVIHRLRSTGGLHCRSFLARNFTLMSDS